jgi:hypothetical protein
MQVRLWAKREYGDGDGETGAQLRVFDHECVTALLAAPRDTVRDSGDGQGTPGKRIRTP